MASIPSLQYTNSFKFFMQFCFANISEGVNDLEFTPNAKVNRPNFSLKNSASFNEKQPRMSVGLMCKRS